MTLNLKRVLRYFLYIGYLSASGQVVLSDELTISHHSVRLNPPGECFETFVSHDLDHITTTSVDPVGFYESNGAGLAVNDLNNDGYLDIVLANLTTDKSVFWNRGGFRFEKETLKSASPTRSVNIVDVDGDSWLDIVFSQQTSAPLYWHNELGDHFARAMLFGVSYNGYAMTWNDTDSDGDLDLVTGSYDAELRKIFGQSGPIAGVIYYENRRTYFVSTRLTGRSNALAIYIIDVNGDGEDDVVVGNDFALEDQYFSYVAGQWQELDSLGVMSHSTMGYDAADIDNNGQLELYAVDMKPYAADGQTLAAWQPVFDNLKALPSIEGDPQIMENILYQLDEQENMENLAPALNLDATGWSWSAKFGDLDNDGFQDLYVVNGMISIELFSHLPNNELVEEDQVFRNIAGKKFLSMNDWGLNSTSSGRGMSMADLDNDGDLDIVVNNLLDHAQVYENQLCRGSAIEVDLLWPHSANTRAIGSQVYLYTSEGVYRRDVKVSSGYLSGDPSRLHFGIPASTELLSMTVVWSDGKQSRLDEIVPNSLITIVRE